MTLYKILFTNFKIKIYKLILKCVKFSTNFMGVCCWIHQKCSIIVELHFHKISLHEGEIVTLSVVKCVKNFTNLMWYLLIWYQFFLKNKNKN